MVKYGKPRSSGLTLPLASHIRDHDLRAGINFPDAFVLDPIVAAQAVRGAERFVTLAARMLFHLLYQEKERKSLRKIKTENTLKN